MTEEKPTLFEQFLRTCESNKIPLSKSSKWAIEKFLEKTDPREIDGTIEKLRKFERKSSRHQLDEKQSDLLNVAHTYVNCRGNIFDFWAFQRFYYTSAKPPYFTIFELPNQLKTLGEMGYLKLKLSSPGESIQEIYV
jgi:hypothetical protein